MGAVRKPKPTDNIRTLGKCESFKDHTFKVVDEKLLQNRRTLLTVRCTNCQLSGTVETKAYNKRILTAKYKGK